MQKLQVLFYGIIYICILQVILSAPDAGTKLLYHDHVIAMVQVARTGFIIKSEIFVIWTDLLAGICWDIDLTTLLPKVVWNDECLHGRKFMS